jgi:hypothetical protein
MFIINVGWTCHATSVSVCTEFAQVRNYYYSFGSHIVTSWWLLYKICKLTDIAIVRNDVFNMSVVEKCKRPTVCTMMSHLEVCHGLFDKQTKCN